MKNSLVLHPFIFAIFPILFLFSHNVGQISAIQIVMPMAITTFITFLFWLLLSHVIKDKEKAGLIVSFFLLLFFSYGHFCSLIGDFGFVFSGVKIGANKILFFTLSLLFVFGVGFFIRTSTGIRNFTNLLNFVAASLIVISLVNIGAHILKERVAFQDNRVAGDIKTNVRDIERIGTLPDIYYIILDGYGRGDILKEIFEYENTEFLGYLRKKGFYIADKSRSNYCLTTLSLASSLNLTYLDDLADRMGIESNNHQPLKNMIRNNCVFNFLKQHGYVIVTFVSGYSATQIENADIYKTTEWQLNEFQDMLLNTTPIPAMLRVLSKYYLYDLHRKRILYVFDNLVDMSEIKVPTFVFAHIIAPHPPFVFGRHGEEINPRKSLGLVDGRDLISKITRTKYLKRYREQLIFINNKLKTILDEILSNSTRPSIIILQADHGPRSVLEGENPDSMYFKERFSILNAYYLPNNGCTHLYREITPVNTFRIVFNHYFSKNYNLLKDESYFSTAGHPYKFIDVTDNIKEE